MCENYILCRILRALLYLEMREQWDPTTLLQDLEYIRMEMENCVKIWVNQT